MSETIEIARYSTPRTEEVARRRNGRPTLPAIAWTFTLLVAAASSVAAQHALPRQFGVLELGMSLERFKTAPGLAPADCAECVDYESLFEIVVDSFAAQLPSSFRHAASTKSPIVDCVFYHAKLARITVTPSQSQVDSARATLEAEFGKSWTRVDWPNGMAQLIWKDKRTVVYLTFVGKTTPGTERQQLGQVLDLTYADRRADAQLRRAEFAGGNRH